MDKEYKFSKAWRDLNHQLDVDYRKLSDKYHELELSHNRKKRALRKISHYCEFYIEHNDGLPRSVVWCFEAIYNLCDFALFSDGRVNERSVVKQKKKGGAK